MEERLNAIQKTIADHDDRLRVIEVKNGANEEMVKTVFRVIDELKESVKNIELSIQNGFKSIEEKVAQHYVTKDQLALFEKDGKYKQVVGGLIGSIITFIVLTGLGLLIAKLGSV